MQNKGLILGSLLLAAFAINLDTTIVNVALPTLVRDLDASTTQLEWIVDAYNLVFAALVLAAGNLGDRIGGRASCSLDRPSSAWPPSPAGSATVRAS
jgi:MFS family permease